MGRISGRCNGCGAADDSGLISTSLKIAPVLSPRLPLDGASLMRVIFIYRFRC